MTRVRPFEFEFTEHDDPRLLAQIAAVRAGGTGWINATPVVEEKDRPQPPGPFAFLGGSTHKIPVVTWLPGKPTGAGRARPVTVGLQHACGPRVAWRLRDQGLPVPEGWKVSQDHPRRGLVALVPAGDDDALVFDWLLRAALLVSLVPTTGRWTASVHAGLA